MMLPLLLAAVAFVHCVLCLLSVSGGWFSSLDNTVDFVSMLVMAFCAVLITAYPYHLLRPHGLNIMEYALSKSIVFGCCALPFLALMAYIYHTYGDGWRPVVVENVWSFSMAYVMCCWGFMIFLVTTSYDLRRQERNL